MKRKAILFGASKCGINFYNKYKEEFDFIYFCDNDSKKWRKIICDLEIISPSELVKFKDVLIIVTSMYYFEIKKQLTSIDVFNVIAYTSFNKNLLTLTNLMSDKLYYYKFNNTTSINGKNLKKMLFIKTFKEEKKIDSIAEVLKKEKFEVDFIEINENLEIKYKEKMHIFKENEEVLNFIDNLEYSLVTISTKVKSIVKNIQTLKSKVTFFYDNSEALKKNIFDDGIIHDFINYELNVENKKEIKVRMKKLIETGNSLILPINNYILSKNNNVQKHDKQRYSDKEIHCVYCGYLSSCKDECWYLESKFLQITKNKIHVHFYTYDAQEAEYYRKVDSISEYIHWEGIISNDINNVISQYDIGLVLFNLNNNNSFFMSTLIPENIFYYNSAKLPIVTENFFIEEQYKKDDLYGAKIKNDIITGGLDGLNYFIIKESIGCSIEISDINLKKSLQAISDMRVKNIVDTEENVKKIVKFYKEVLNFNSEYKNTKFTKKELTIVIPTKNRFNYLKRCLTYFYTMNDERVSLKILILDSSNKIKEKENISKFLKDNYFYDVEYCKFDEGEKFQFYEKILCGVKKVNTKHFIMCADDDLLIKNSILKSLKIMEENSSISTVIGLEMYFYNNDLSEIYYNPKGRNFIDIFQEDSIKRLKFYADKQLCAFFYNLYETDNIKEVFETIVQYKLENGTFKELLLFFLTVASGKIKKMEEALSISDATVTSDKFTKSNF